MARILITGSAEGLGSLAAKALSERGHEVHLHARSQARAEDAKKNCPQAKSCFVADLSELSQVQKLADDVKAAGPWDSIIHNAGVMRDVAGKTAPGADYGLLFATNTLAPYVLTSLVAEHSKRYVFLGSQMHAGGDGSLKNLTTCGYGDSKLHDIMLGFAFARLLKNVDEVNVIDPGWVPTKMGGANATDDINTSIETYVALAEGIGRTGEYWGPSATKDRKYQPIAGDVTAQEKLLSELAQISGVQPPHSKL